MNKIKKSFIAIVLASALGLVLTSCEKRSYTIEVVDCASGKVDTIETDPTAITPRVEVYKLAVPRVYIGNFEYVYNKCSCRILN